MRVESPDGTLSLELLPFGATLKSLQVSASDGSKVDVVLGFEDDASYENPSHPYLGSTVGRVANRCGCLWRLLVGSF
jgi:aldose 1-epimerase